MMSDPLTMIATYQPGTMTPENAMELAESFRALLNAVAQDLDPNSGEVFKFQKMEWIDDGIDTLTVRVGG